MKNLGLLCFCTMVFTPASAQDELEQAIRSLDVSAVEQIVKRVSVKPKEYNCYLLLAEEMVRSREIWVLKDNYYGDITTPYDGPSDLRLNLGFVSACLGLFTTILCTGVFFERGDDKAFSLIGCAFGAALVGRYMYDERKCTAAVRKLKERLRNKYEDAVTIRQRVCALDIAVE